MPGMYTGRWIAPAMVAETTDDVVVRKSAAAAADLSKQVVDEEDEDDTEQRKRWAAQRSVVTGITGGYTSASQPAYEQVDSPVRKSGRRVYDPEHWRSDIRGVGSPS